MDAAAASVSAAASASAAAAASAAGAASASMKKFKNKTFCFSGKFNEFNRTDAQALIVARGGRCVDDVSSTLQYFVVGENPGPAKLSKSRQWRIATLSEFEFLDFVGDAQGALKKPSRTTASVTASVAPLSTVTAASLAAADSSTSFAVPRYGVLPPNTLPLIRAQIAAKRSSTFSSLVDSTRWTARFAPVSISEQVVSKSDTMLVCLSSSLEDARVDFLAAVRSFVQIAQFALKADVQDLGAVPGYLGMTMVSLRVSKVRRVERFHVLQGQMVQKGQSKKTSHFIGPSILMAVTLADGERWEKFEAIIDNGERDLYNEGHRTGKFSFCNDMPSLGKTSAKHLEATGATAVLFFYICLQTVQQNVNYLNGVGFGFYKAPNVGSGKGPRRLKCWRCETCSGFITWSGLKTCGNPKRCSTRGDSPSKIQKYEEGQESMEEAILTGQYVLYDCCPDLDRARPIFDHDVPLPPPPLPPLMQLPLQQLPPQQLLPLPMLLPPPLFSPPLPPPQQPPPTQLPPPPQQPAPPPPLQPLPPPQLLVGWQLVFDDHSAVIDIPYDALGHHLGRNQLAEAASRAENAPQVELAFVSRVQIALTAETEGGLKLESLGTNAILVSSGGTGQWEKLCRGETRTLLAGDKIAFDHKWRTGTVVRLRLGDSPPPSFRWLWDSGHGGFTAYNSVESVVIEMQFIAGGARCDLGAERYVDFTSMRQVRNDNHSNYRRVRREVIADGAAGASSSTA